MATQTRWSRFGFPVLATLALFTAAMADFLFYKHNIGWTFGGFVGWLVLLILVRHGRAILTGPMRALGWLTAVMMVGVCVSLVIEPGVIAWVLALFGLGTLAILSRGGWPSRRLGWSWLRRLCNVWFFSLIQPLRDNRIVRRWHKRTASLAGKVAAAGRWLWAVISIVIPVILSLIFLGLFAIANPVVADWMRRGFDEVGEVLSNLTDYISVLRILLWYGAAFVCWGLLRYRPSRTRQIRLPGVKPIVLSAGQQVRPSTPDAVRSAAEAKREQGQMVGQAPAPQPEKPAESQGIWDWLMTKYQDLIVRCLIAMNIVFALQLVLDSRYLVLREALPEGMTHAEYAHRGAYPLIFTAILAAALVLAVFRPGGVAERSKWARGLVMLWIAQNVLLVFSAAWRLAAYVDVYTLTRLRVAAAVWMLMVAGCLALLLIRILTSRDNSWLTGWAMGWGILVLWVCSFVPFDPMIAQYNVRNCQELGGHAGPIDVAYLEQLGPDALPAIDYLLEHMPEATANAAQFFDEDGRGRSDDRAGVGLVVSRADYEPGYGYEEGPTSLSLQEHLELVSGRLSRELESDMDDWRGWTPRRAWLRQTASR